MKITTKGEHHLGAVIGSESFKTSYINAKVDGWIEDVKELANIAEDEPQLAYIKSRERLIFTTHLGMGIQNPVDTSDSEFMACSAITRNLTDLIMQQTTDVDKLDRAEMAKVKSRSLQKRNEDF